MVKLKGLAHINALKKSLPSSAPASSRTSKAASKGAGKGMMLMVPAETLQALKVKAAEQGTTTRALVLEALKKDGYPVTDSELRDRRKDG